MNPRDLYEKLQRPDHWAVVRDTAGGLAVRKALEMLGPTLRELGLGDYRLSCVRQPDAALLDIEVGPKLWAFAAVRLPIEGPEPWREMLAVFERAAIELAFRAECENGEV